MADWHPIRMAYPVQKDADGDCRWYMANGPIEVEHERFAILTRLRFNAETWYRATTWASRSDDRELLGYFRNLPTAAAYAWEDHLLRGRELHGMKAGTYTGAAPPHGRPVGFRYNDENAPHPPRER